MSSKRFRLPDIEPLEPVTDEIQPLLRRTSTPAQHEKPGEIYRILPIVLLYGLGYGVYMPSYFELMRFKVCDQHLNYSEEACLDIGSQGFSNEGDVVRKITAQYQLYSCVLECLPAIVLSIFLGSWSDHTGRKTLMTFPFFGVLFAAAWTALCSHRNFPVETLLISSFLSAICGGRFVILMAFYSYAGDASTRKNRAFNNAVVEGLNILGMHVGYFISGFVYQHFGHVAPFVASSGFFSAALLCTLLFVHERRIDKVDNRRKIFSLANLKEGTQVLTKERSGDTRFHISLVVMASLISNSAFSGKNAVTQIFLEFRPFSWTLTHYTIFASILGLGGSISVIFCTKIIRKFVGTDSAMAMIAYTSAITGYIIYSIAHADWMIYLAAALGHLRLLCTVCIRSLLQEMAGPEDIGKIMAVVSVVQSLSPLIGSVVFVNLFSLTAAWWSGLCFAVGSFLLIIDLAIFSYLDVVRRDWLYTRF